MRSAAQQDRTDSAGERRDLPVRSLPRSARALWQVGVAAVAGAVVGAVVAVSPGVNAVYGVLCGWDVAAVVYLVWIWAASWWLDPEGTAAAAEREDPTRAAMAVILLWAAVASLVAVVYSIADAGKSSGGAQIFRVALGIASIFCSWFVVHTVFTMSYAHEYYLAEDGGIDFNMPRPPIWSDFAYLSFTIGMTFQVSDTELQTSALRRIALRQMLISYLFGAVIIALTINLVAGITK